VLACLVTVVRDLQATVTQVPLAASSQHVAYTATSSYSLVGHGPLEYSIWYTLDVHG